MNKEINRIIANVFLVLGLLTLNFSCVRNRNLKELAEHLRVKNNIPGMAVAVVRADTIPEIFVLGHRRGGHPDKVQLDDLFHIGSNTKAMTAFAAAHLVEQGIIDWSSRFFDLYPDWKNEIDSSHWDVKLGGLLSHRAKIKPYWTEEEFDSLELIPINLGTKSERRRAFSKYVLTQPPTIPDSIGYRYSNAGYSIAAQMLEKASDMTWEELLLKVFNNDLNLGIGFSWPNKVDENQPWGHWTEDGQLSTCPPDDDYNLDFLEPGGDVHISLPSYCKFIQLQLQGLSGRDNYLKSSTYDLLHNDRKNSVYAYGWANFVQDDYNYSWHAGSAGTFLTKVFIDKTASVAYIVMMNTNSPEAWNLETELREKMEDLYGGSEN
ncbi:MAG: serine hydrolase domain-containing protein [Bacteroidota bacterium]